LTTNCNSYVAFQRSHSWTVDPLNDSKPCPMPYSTANARQKLHPLPVKSAGTYTWRQQRRRTCLHCVNCQVFAFRVIVRPTLRTVDGQCCSAVDCNDSVTLSRTTLTLSFVCWSKSQPFTHQPVSLTLSRLYTHCHVLNTLLDRLSVCLSVRLSVVLTPLTRLLQTHSVIPP